MITDHEPSIVEAIDQAERVTAARAHLMEIPTFQEPAMLNGSPQEWPEPVPFDSFEAYPLPVDVLPSWALDFTLAAAAHVQVASCLVLANVLGAVATVTAGKLVVEVKPGYSEPLNLYILAPAPPAERKTAAQFKALAPLYTWEAEQAQAIKKEVVQAISQRKSQEAVISGQRSKLARSKPEAREGLIREIAELEASMMEVPRAPRLLADDITPEATATLMAQHNERLGIASCEGGIFEILAGRYSNGIPNLDLMLKAHAGEPVRVDRKVGAPVIMNAPALTLTLSPQPDVLVGLVDKPGFRGRGLLGRFIYVLPQSQLGSRCAQSPTISTSTKHAYQNALYRLLDMKWSRGASDEDHAAHVLHLEDKAFTVWADFFDAIEVELADGGRFETLRDWAGKLPGLAARLAGNLHVMEHLDQAPDKYISFDSMTKAVKLAAALAGHALAAFGLMGADPELEAGKHVLGWIRREGFAHFSLRRCHRGVRGRLKTAAQVRAALEALEERGYILPEHQDDSRPKQPGRPPSPTFIVNPKALEVA